MDTNILTLRQAAALSMELAENGGPPPVTLNTIKSAAYDFRLRNFKIGDGKTSPRYVTRIDFVAWLEDADAHRRGAKRKEKENGER